MLQMRFFNVIRFFLFIYILPLIISARTSLSDVFNTEESKLALRKFAIAEKWTLRYIAKMSVSFLEAFLVSPPSGTIEQMVNAGGTKTRYINTGIGYTFMMQVPLTVTVVLGILIALLLCFLPVFIAYYRTLEFGVDSGRLGMIRVTSSRSAWVFYQFFLVCSGCAVLGAFLLIISSVRSYLIVSALFNFASYTVNMIFMLKDNMSLLFQQGMQDVSRNAFERIMHLHDYNEQVGYLFMKNMFDKFAPILSQAVSMHWELYRAAETLESQSSQLRDFANDTRSTVRGHSARFNMALQRLVDIRGNDTSLIERLQLPEFNVTADAAETLRDPIQKLKELSKVNLQTGYRELLHQLKKTVTELHYDPSDLIEELKHVTFSLENKARDAVEKYVTFVEVSLKSGNSDEVGHNIETLGKETQYFTYSVLCVLLFFAFFSIVCILVTVAAYSAAVLGTNGFQQDDEGGSIKKSNLSNSSGRVLLFFCYFISCYLWMCWACSLFLFVTTSLPLQFCLAFKDKSIFDVTVDSLKVRHKPQWYGIFSSYDYNTTMKRTITTCQNDTGYVIAFPEIEKEGKEHQRDLISKLNFTAAEKTFGEAITNLPYFNISSANYSLSNITGTLDGLETHSFFTAMGGYLEQLIKVKVLKVLTAVKMSANNSETNTTAEKAIQEYFSIIKNVQSVFEREQTFNATLEVTRTTLQTIPKEMSHLVWISEALYEAVVNKSVPIYIRALNQTVAKMVKEVFLDMELTLMDFRKSVSFCKVLVIFYDKSVSLTCNIIMYPMAVCWLGSMLLSFFFVGVVLFAVPVVHLFMHPHKHDWEEDHREESTHQISSANQDDSVTVSPSEHTCEGAGKYASHARKSQSMEELRQVHDPADFSRSGSLGSPTSTRGSQSKMELPRKHTSEDIRGESSRQISSANQDDSDSVSRQSTLKPEAPDKGASHEYKSRTTKELRQVHDRPELPPSGSRPASQKYRLSSVDFRRSSSDDRKSQSSEDEQPERRTSQNKKKRVERNTSKTSKYLPKVSID